MKIWVYKVNSSRRVGPTAWHFDRYFKDSRSRPYPMGGYGWIRSPQSWQRLRQIRANDLFVCYQSDERKIYGLARAAGSGYESLPGSGIFDSVDFAPGGIRFASPLPVAHRATKAVFRNVSAFTVPSRGTIHEVRADEFRAVVAAAIDWNQPQKKVIREFIARL